MNKRDIVLAFIALIVILAALWRSCRMGNDPGPPQPPVCNYDFPSFNPDYPAPAATPASEQFALSQAYPAQAPTITGAWQGIDFTTDAQGYAAAVLAYCMEGNTAVDFKVQDNAVRKWYHVPWLHYGPNGREWRRGLTKERYSRAGEIHPQQTSSASSAAIGFYNAAGAYTLGQVWPDCGGNIPNPRAAIFPEGTVTFKLLFTTTTEVQVPFLHDPITWRANISTSASPARSDQDMQLLQVDVAVKDQRSPIGWVFGTFVYNGNAPAADRWQRFSLVGLSWGNDPGVATQLNTFTAFINSDLHQSWLNPDIIGNVATPSTDAKVYHVGLGGRLNGPVDNKISSCTSCHGKAAVLKDMQPDPIENIGRMPKSVPSTLNDGTVRPESFTDYFGQNVPPGSADITYNCFVSSLSACAGPTPNHTFICTDYSLQVALGIENYYSSLNQRAQEYLDRQVAPKNE